MLGYTGFSSEIGTKLRDWAVGQAGGSCYSWAALSSNDSKTLYNDTVQAVLNYDCDGISLSQVVLTLRQINSEVLQLSIEH